MIFRRWGGGSTTGWNFSENSSVLVSSPIPMIVRICNILDNHNNRIILSPTHPTTIFTIVVLHLSKISIITTRKDLIFNGFGSKGRPVDGMYQTCWVHQVQPWGHDCPLHKPPPQPLSTKQPPAQPSRGLASTFFWKYEGLEKWPQRPWTSVCLTIELQSKCKLLPSLKRTSISPENDLIADSCEAQHKRIFKHQIVIWHLTLVLVESAKCKHWTGSAGIGGTKSAPQISENWWRGRAFAVSLVLSICEFSGLGRNLHDLR